MPLFNHLPDDLFRPLASPNRAFHAALLLHLYEKTFGVLGETPRRNDVIADIGDFIESYEQVGEIVAGDDVAADEPDGRGQDSRRHSVYRYLLQTGWLIEHKDRYVRLVDFDPDARLLLQELARIAGGDSRSYGGAVLQVLGSLESALANPRERSEAVRNAARFARDFMQHLRTVAAAMRKVEEQIVSQDSLRDLFRSFFEEFVEKHLIQDFKTLHTKNNPFRFRNQIIRQAWEILENAPAMAALADSYVREGRAATSEEAFEVVTRELDAVIKVFESVDRQLEVIEETNGRIERRIANTVRYMDRVNDNRIDRVAEALRALAATSLAPEDAVEIPPDLVVFDPPIGPGSFYAERRARTGIGRQGVRTVERDPALDAYQAAKTAFSRRVAVTPDRIEAYLERALGDADFVDAADLPLATIDDFFTFQRLRELPFLFGGRLRNRYRVEILDGRFSSDWIDCPNFRIHRIRPEQAAA